MKERRAGAVWCGSASVLPWAKYGWYGSTSQKKKTTRLIWFEWDLWLIYKYIFKYALNHINKEKWNIYAWKYINSIMTHTPLLIEMNGSGINEWMNEKE